MRLPPAASNALRIWSRSAAWIVRSNSGASASGAAGTAASAAVSGAALKNCTGRCSGKITGPWATINARSITFKSSRMFPGHA